MPTLTNMKRLLIGIALGAAIALAASCMAPSELDSERQTYCKNVREGVWPDYQAGRYKRECGGKDAPKFDANLTK